MTHPQLLTSAYLNYVFHIKKNLICASQHRAILKNPILSPASLQPYRPRHCPELIKGLNWVRAKPWEFSYHGLKITFNTCFKWQDYEVRGKTPIFSNKCVLFTLANAEGICCSAWWQETMGSWSAPLSSPPAKLHAGKLGTMEPITGSTEGMLSIRCMMS